MDKKLITKIVDNIQWKKNSQDCWEGSFTLKDGYQISVAAAMDMKMREAKSLVKELLPIKVVEAAEERGVAIF